MEISNRGDRRTVNIDVLAKTISASTVFTPIARGNREKSPEIGDIKDVRFDRHASHCATYKRKIAGARDFREVMRSDDVGSKSEEARTTCPEEDARLLIAQARRRDATAMEVWQLGKDRSNRLPAGLIGADRATGCRR
ncbi:hypothetical protein KM043_009390 [Ampulex compressa]|nr:hypothetical protein KM043_009390 [Ampulex compressa]